MQRILLVDDDKVSRDMLKSILTKEGFECFVAENGEQAFKLFKERPYDIVITDYRMPISSGQELLTRIKSVSPKTEVIMLSGSTDFEMIPLFKQQGALACLEKPLVLNELLTVLNPFIMLPVVADTAKASKSTDMSSEPKNSTEEKTSSIPKRILIVDDDVQIRGKLKMEFERNFFQTAEASTGQEALEIARKGEINILLVDINLPDMNGMEIIKKLKEEGLKTQVIVITGFGSQDVAIQALRLGAIDYIEKPVDMEQLNAAIGRAFEKMEKDESTSYKNTILVIDDEQAVVRKLREFLEKEQYKTFGAFNGKEGLDIVLKNKIDVIVTDVRMHPVDGVEVLKKSKSFYPDIEVIMMTGHGDHDAAVEALRLGASDYIQKPIDLDEVLHAIGKAIERNNLYRTRLYRNRELKLTSEIMSRMNVELEQKVEERTKELGSVQSQLFQTSKLATLGEMSAGLAHEMNQPLAGIALTTLNMRKLRERSLLSDEKFKENINDIEMSVERMKRIINHIRIFSRQDTFNFVEVNVNNVIESALGLLGEQLRLHQIEVITNLDPDIAKIQGEPYQLEQVVINFISNARDALDENEKKHTERISKKITFTTRQEGDEVVFIVSDNGIGMSPQVKEKIFQPFFTNKEVGKGTGLGMSISYGIVESHKGRIEVESVEGKGSDILVFLPVPNKAKE